MNKLFKRLGLIFLLISLATMLAACGNDNKDNGDKQDNANTPKDNANKEANENNEAEPEQEPVTLKFNYGWDEEFEEDIKGPVEAKFPHITLEFVDLSVDNIEEEIAKENLPDIFYLSGADQLPILEDYDLAYDLTDMINEKDFDLDRISDAHVEVVNKWSEGDSFNYFPYVRRFDVMYYNKEIFDKFGVDYPTDGMTWDEVANLAKQVHGEIDGRDYRGIDIGNSSSMLKELEVNHVDPETDESLYASDERFAKYLSMIDTFNNIPGIIPAEDEGGDFISEQNVAMLPLYDIHNWLKNVEIDTGLSWDMVSYPVWEDAKTKGPTANAAGLTISSLSEHKEAAFQVLEYLMSDEWQLMRSKKGLATILKDKDIQATFAEEVEEFEDKNMQAVFALELTSGPENASKYEDQGNIIDAMEYAREHSDINTYLRELSEEANIIINDIKASE